MTAVCSTGNVEQAHALGADDVVDYTTADFTRGGRRYDLVFDVAGSRSWRELKRVLEPEATVVLVGGSMSNRWLGPLGHVVRLSLASLPGSRKTTFFIAKFNKPDLEVLRGLLETGQLTPVVDRQYPLADVAEAFRYLGDGHAQAKVVLTP